MPISVLQSRIYRPRKHPCQAEKIEWRWVGASVRAHAAPRADFPPSPVCAWRARCIRRRCWGHAFREASTIAVDERFEPKRDSGAAHMEKLQALRQALGSIEREASKFFEKGNQAAGKRARKHLLEARNLCSELRKVIQEQKKELKGTRRTNKAGDGHDSGMGGTSGSEGGSTYRYPY